MRRFIFGSRVEGGSVISRRSHPRAGGIGKSHKPGLLSSVLWPLGKQVAEDTARLNATCLAEALEQRVLLSLDPQLNPDVDLSPYAPVTVQQSQPGSTPGTNLLPPAAFTLRPTYITSVKNQGACGSCWAFATYGSLESSILKTGGPTTDLSENNLKNYHGFDWGPCDGGNTSISEAYLSRGSGPVSETDDLYHAWDDRVTPAPSYPKQYWVTEMLRFDTSDEIKNALMARGAQYTSMYWTDSSYRASDYTYYYTGTGGNHGVTIVGWDDSKVTAAATPGAWLIKNSWGASWGDGGYFWLSYADSVGGKRGEFFGGAVAPSTYDSVYYWDQFGNVSSLNSTWAMNRFVPTGAEQLKAVGFFTQADNAGYNITVYDNYSGGTLSGLLASGSGTAATAGWHTIDLASPANLTTGNDFYIAVQITNGGTYPQAFDYAYSGYSSASTAAPNQSWYSFNGSSWTDLTTYKATGNFCIKAFTKLPPANVIELSGTSFQITNPTLYGGQANVSLSVLNIGDLAAGGFDVKFYLSDDANIDPGTDILLTLSQSDPHYNLSEPSAYRIASLAAATTHNGTVMLTVPAADPFNTDNSYYIGMVTDADGEVAEANESNNLNRGDGIDLAASGYTAVVYGADMNADPGWTLQGQWAWGQPTGGGGAHGFPDPTGGYTGANVIGYNLGGDYAASIGTTQWATTAAINCSDITQTTLSFYRWLGVEDSDYDHAYVAVSNDGTTWTTIWQNIIEVADGSWQKYTYDISAVADRQTTVFVRWGMGATDDSYQFCGWNVDDVLITGTPAGLDTAGPTVTGQTPTGTVATGQGSMRFTFNESMDTGSFVVADDVVSFTGPGGVDLKPQITGFTWLSNQMLEVQFNPQSAVGAYTMVVGPDITDDAPTFNPMNQDGDAVNGETAEDRYTGSFATIASLYLANMDSDPGWTLDAGAAPFQWQYGTPTGSSGDPTSGRTGDNVVGYNLAGHYSDLMSTTEYATTPAFSTAGYTDIRLGFWRWLGVEASSFDHANIQIWDGSTWTTVWDHTSSTLIESNWSYQEYTLPASANNKPQVMIRWGMGPTDDSVTYSGWNIDDVWVAGTPLAPSAIPSVPDLLPASDSGASSTDDVTNLDNNASKTLQFAVDNTVAGATVTVYADGTAVGSTVAAGTTTIVTTDGALDLVDGSHSLTARQTEPGKPESANSGILTVIVDTVAPLLANIEGTSLTYVAGAPATAITANLTLSHGGSDLAAATVWISAGFASGEDVLGFSDQNGISGIYNPVTGVLSLAGMASLANYEAAVRSVTYATSGQNPSPAERTISFLAGDPAGNDSTATGRNVAVMVNPTLSGGTEADGFYARASADGQSLLVWTNDTAWGDPACAYPLNTLNSLVFDTLESDDSLTLDFANGNFIPVGGLIYNGGIGTNTLTIIGVGDVDELTVNPGQVLFGTSSITVTGISGITLDSPAGLPIWLHWLTINDTATVALPGTGGKVLHTSNLSINGTGILNLSDGGLVVEADASGPAPADVAASVIDWIGQGRIIANSASPIHGLAAMLNDDGAGNTLLSSFPGSMPLTTGSIIVKYTLNGDGDFNGVIDGDDYFRIDMGYVRGKSGYYNGDFNYDTMIDADDYFAIDRAFMSRQIPPAPAALPASIALSARVALPAAKVVTAATRTAGVAKKQAAKPSAAKGRGPIAKASVHRTDTRLTHKAGQRGDSANGRTG